MSGVNWGGFSR